MKTKAEIFAAQKLPPVPFDTGDPTWGVVLLKQWTGVDRVHWEDFAAANSDEHGNWLPNVAARETLVQRTVCDEKGELIFGEADIRTLGDSSGATLEKIKQAASKLNCLTIGEVARALANFLVKPLAPGTVTSTEPKGSGSG